MKIETMMELKREYGYTNEYISESTGIAVGTIQKIFSGETKRPRRETLLALEKLFTDPRRAVFPGPVYDFLPTGEKILVKEQNLAEKYCAGPRGSFTAADLEDLPEGQRAEVIDGVIYNLASPTLIHQFITDEILTALKNHVREHQGDCLPVSSPLDVYPDCDDKTCVQPDILILCDRSKIGKDEKIWGAPDLIMEILSPSTKMKDGTIKLEKYCTSGVREYWLIDPKEKQITVCDFAHRDLFHHYTFHDSVPVGIWDGACAIDFDQILQGISDIFGKDA